MKDEIDDLAWVDEALKKEPDEETKRFSNLLSKYEETFGVIDFGTEPCYDYDRIMEQMETCIRLNIPYSKLYKTKISKNIFY